MLSMLNHTRSLSSPTGVTVQMIGAEFDALTYANIEALVANGVTEGRQLEFKRDLPGGSDSEVKEFLADVSALANAHGGDIVIGVDENDGVAVAIPGIASNLAEAAILAFENRLRDNLEPRLSGVRIAWLANDNDRGVIVIRVPASLSAPHRVTFKNWGRFFVRNNMSKSEMDTHELRIAFNAMEGMLDRFHALHSAAQARAMGENMPVALPPYPYAVATVTPLSFFREVQSFPITRENAVAPYRQPGIAGDFGSLPMLEGMLLHEFPMEGRVSSYALTHWSGRTEAAWQIGWDMPGQGVGMVPIAGSPIFERGLRDAARSSLARLTALGIAGPWILQVSIHRVGGRRLIRDQFFQSEPTWRDAADLAQLSIDQANNDDLMPVARAFWLTFGVERPVELELGT